MKLADEKYISVATFRKSGEAVATPTWVVPLDDATIGFWTSSRAGKVKRLRNNSSVTLVPSDSRGRVKDGATSIPGTAKIVTSGPQFDTIQSRVRAKYGLMVPLSKLFNKIGHIGKGNWPYGDLGIVVTPDAGA